MSYIMAFSSLDHAFTALDDAVTNRPFTASTKNP